MQLKIDFSKCVNCGECVRACPQLAEEKSMSIFNCDQCGSCAAACPKSAFYEVDGVLRIDPEKCDNCGACVSACEKKAVVQQSAFPAKCDLCLAHERPLCVAACPYGAITPELSCAEKEKMSDVAGWRCEQVEGKTIDETEFADIIKSGEVIRYAMRVKEPSYDEVCVAEKLIAAVRKTNADEKDLDFLFDEYCESNHLIVSDEQKKSILELVRSETSGFSIISRFLADDSLEELSLVGAGKNVFVYHKKHGWLESNVSVYNDAKVRDLINKIGRNLGRRITLQKPRMNANVSLGRVHAAISPVAVSGSCITIRKFNARPFSPAELVANGTVSPEAMAFLSMAVQCDVNVLVCGNTGSGKTSTLNTLFSFIPENERVVVIEETPEVMLPHNHAVRLSVTENVAMHELVEDTLRMRPDRIIVGEVRTPSEAKALLNTMLAGQGKSSFATFHAQNAEEALIRLMNLGISAVDLHAIDVIVVQRRWTDLREKRDLRRVTEICCLKKDYSGKPKIDEIFSYDAGKKALIAKNIFRNPVSEKIMACFGLDRKGFERELARRAKGF
ncbi:MAG: ATPase, T2SS/T4P/T4SS family [archaeon]